MSVEYRKLVWISVCVLFTALNACTPKKAIEAAGKMAAVAMDPDMPIGAPKEVPSVSNLTIYSEPDVNKNSFGESSPLDVWIFQLSDESKFLSTDFETLTSDIKGTLDTGYVDHKQVQAEPNKSKIVTDWEIKKETRLIGVAVGYKDIDKVDWRAVEKINPKGEKYKVVIVTKNKFVLLEVHR